MTIASALVGLRPMAALCSSLLIRVHLRFHLLLPSKRGTDAAADLGQNAPEQAPRYLTE